MKLDYSIISAEDRVTFVDKLITSKGEDGFTNRALEIMANYILFAMTKEEKKSKKIVTDNRKTTMKKREMSFEGLSEKLEQGGSGIQNLVANDKGIIFSHAISITPQDIEDIPYLKQLRETIDKLEGGTYSGREAFVAKKTIIELRQDQYVMKQSQKPPTRLKRKTESEYNTDWYVDVKMNADGEVVAEGLCTLLREEHVKAMLATYKFLRPEVSRASDIYYLLDDLDEIMDALPPILSDLAKLKVAECTNQEIQDKLIAKHGVTHSLEYLSSLWQNKVPKLITEMAQERWMNWHYTTQEKGVWKTCTRCGDTKLAHNIYFSKNKTDPSGYYSICKACRNKKVD